MPQGENVNGLFLKSFMRFLPSGVFTWNIAFPCRREHCVSLERFGTWKLLGLGTLGARKWDGERWACGKKGWGGGGTKARLKFCWISHEK
jgi:hypothetical protein